MYSRRADELGWILQEKLTYRLAEVLKKKPPNLPFANGELLPDIADLPPGAESIAQELIEEYGEAAFMAATPDEIPLAEVALGEDKLGVATIVAGCKYNIRELDSADFAARNGQRVASQLRDLRIERMYRMLEEKTHRLGAFGSVGRGLRGILNNPDVPVLNSNFELQDNDSTDIIDWFAENIGDIRDVSNLVETPTTICCSERCYRFLQTRYRSSGSDLTLLQAILQVTPIQRVIPLNELKREELDKNGIIPTGTSRERMLIYSPNPDNLYRRFEPIRIMQPQLRGMDYYMYAFKTVSSVYFKYPLSARYVEFREVDF